MTEETPPADEEKPLAEENYWETAAWGPWPTRKNNQRRLFPTVQQLDAPQRLSKIVPS
ncbi:hypothetical protein LB572_11095 [Mesorhizobium sp. BH1-1-5]|uniref:hypothetical protein n=1 Tax=unclassified Mesorhizobium TaxID=325217 RepID=UPI0015E2BA4B|nr:MULTISPECIES: hypothetical protein [unclassified Mesorhizobium]MBZ9987643.1 hypothetical protein [Mesorhizobium sp. BH1-1-5]